MRLQRSGVLLVLLSFNAPAFSAEPGFTIDGRFFPYAVEGAVLETAKPKEETHCGCWRVVGAFAGGAAGFIGYIPAGLSEARIGVSDTQRMLEWSAVTAGSALLGYWLGKKLEGC
jgi:hypothetical protein